MENKSIEYLFLNTPGIRYVPDFVFRSPWFWLGMAVMIAGILLFHNKPWKKRNGRHF